MIRRLASVMVRPRATFAGLVARPQWMAAWALILIIWAVCGGWFLSTDTGQQALVDERVRVIETFGGVVSDDEYFAWLTRPPWWVYFTSGGRVLLTPLATVLVAVMLWAVARIERVPARFAQTLAIAVHASVVLLLGQVLATPLHFVRESLTSPLNFAAILPLMEEGTLPARFFGSLDIFAVWWAALLAVGLSVLTGQRVGRYGKPLAAVYVVFAAVISAMIAVMGGS